MLGRAVVFDGDVQLLRSIFEALQHAFPIINSTLKGNHHIFIFYIAAKSGCLPWICSVGLQLVIQHINEKKTD